MKTERVKPMVQTESLGSEVKALLLGNIRDYAMYIALVVIFVIFTVATKGLFLSSRNLINLVNQTGYVAVLAIGMTLILIIKHIDLSVGFVAGFTGAIAAILLMKGWNVWLVIPTVLACGGLPRLLGNQDQGSCLCYDSCWHVYFSWAVVLGYSWDRNHYRAEQNLFAAFQRIHSRSTLGSTF